MTYCPKLYKLVEKGLEQKKSLKEIGQDLCPDVKNPQGKIARIVKMTMGKEEGTEYLIKNKDWTKYTPPHNKDGKNKNKKDKAKNFGSYPKITEIAEEDETPEKIAEEEIQIPIKPIVKKRLDFIMKNYSTRTGQPIDSYNKAIRFALRTAGLWDILE